MKKFEDLTGQKFNNLKVIAYAYTNSHGETYWLCKCNCGNTKVVRRSHLINGTTKSCGCLMRYKLARRNKANAKYGGCSKTRIYSIWQGMKNRCLNVKTNGYKNYGGKGISICKEWLDDYMNFYDWAMNNGYNDNLILARIDINQDYFPENCKWLTAKEQARRTNKAEKIKFRGVTLGLAEWAEKLKINKNTLQSRLRKYNWSIKKALTTPTKH